MADIEIRIKGKDDASDELKTVTKAVEKLDNATDKASSNAKTSGSKWDSLMTSFTGINQAVQLAQQAFQALQQVYDVVITKTVAYADQVRELSRAIGATPEDASKLIQAADDVFVSFDSLTTGMNIAIRNGLEPTIEGMGRLADEYLAIEDPIKRTEFLLKSFGRSGADLAPLMELGADGIRELGDAAEETGLVLNQEALDATIEYKEAVDALTDTFNGFATELGQAVIPTLTEFINLLNTGFKASNIKTDINNIVKELIKLGYTEEELFKISGMSKKFYFFDDETLIEEGTVALERLTNLLPQAKANADGLTQALSLDAEAVANAGGELVKLGDTLGAAAEEQQKLTDALHNVVTIESNYKGIIGLAYKYTDILEEMSDIQEQMSDPDLGAEEYAELEGQLEGLKGTMKDLANQVALDMFQATIAIGGVTAAELGAYMQMAIDMGLMSEEGAQAAMDAYGEAVETINSYEIDEKKGNLVVDAAQAWETIKLYEQLVIADKTGNIDIFIKYHKLGSATQDWAESNYDFTGDGNTPPNGGGAAGKYVHGYAGGGPFPVGEIGPELFFPSQDGRILSNSETKAALRSGRGGGETINVTINTPVNFADRAFVERELAPYIKSVMKDALRT